MNIKPKPSILRHRLPRQTAQHGADDNEYKALINLMRSSKQRSRSKSNRNRPSGGNVVNRVFDSSGPEGKVRGTPQQIIEKYNQLARDAQLGNDRVAAENFQQHAEHYLRMLSEAQKEIDARREEQERQNRERQAQADRDRERDREKAERADREAQRQAEAQQQAEAEQRSSGPDTMEVSGGDEPQAEESNLVETPESTTPPKPRRKPRAKKAPASDTQASEKSDGSSAKGAEAAE